MNKLKTLAASALGLALTHVSASATDLTDQDKQFLTKYEQVRAALAADDFEKTKTAAAEMGEDGNAIAKSDKIATARAEFAKLSERAIQLGRGQSGYYVVNCPMLKKDWLQSFPKISNPYAGKSMPECGMIKK